MRNFCNFVDLLDRHFDRKEVYISYFLLFNSI